ncbi:TetR/AcrR family transcriptional regulator [Brachybacterium sp. ACRRE]|uniref:TetR/AcrR family transcriptional regulator n=1 Tax=Brachybacterium sp. ACRRE TaxID=2918184 RepID=UPI001EF2827D|nr:TetR-like C-terminal domain-containing protein [Brachybacterium sp. ACRRE]MCG7308112.1 WHG domain-containing protein [Brachybacterium sp. ACRRE]
MPRSDESPSAARDTDLRASLLAAAEAELAEHGPEGLRLRAVARRAGVSHAAPGYVFGGMRGMLTALATKGFGALADRLAEAGDPAPLTALGEAYVRFAGQEPTLFSLMFRTALLETGDPDLIAAQERAFAPIAAHGETREHAVMFWALAHGAAILERDGQLTRAVPGEGDDAPAEGVVRLFAQTLGE